MAAYANVLCAIPGICFVIGPSWISIVSLKDLTNDLPLLMVGERRSLQNRQEIKKRFCNFVQQYLDVKELSVNISIVKYKPSN